METFLNFLHVLICLLLLLVILLQPGKSSGMSGAFGGAGGGGNFGAKSPTTVLSRFTVVMAAAFMLSSLTLAWMSVREHSVLIEAKDDTHHPTAGLAYPGDLSVSEEEMDQIEPKDPLEDSDETQEPKDEVIFEAPVDEDAVLEQESDLPDDND